MTKATPTIEEMRAQRDDLERQLAAASVGSAADYVGLLESSEVDGLMTAITNAVAPLDDATRKRVASWVKMRTDLATLAKLELNRLRGLVAADAPAPEGGATTA